MFSELSKALGAEETVEHKGKVYRLAPVDRLEVVAAWEDWLGDQALDFLLRRLAKLGPDGMTKACEAVGKLAAEGKFDFWGEVSNQRLCTLEGQKKLVGLRVKLNDPSVTDATVAEIVEDRWEILARLLQKESAAEATDPNVGTPGEGPPPPGGAPAGEPSSPDSSATGNGPSSESGS